MFDDAAITGEIESNNLLDKHSFNNWTGQGMTEINPTTDISHGFNPNSTPEQQNIKNIIMYRNKDKQNKIPLEKKLTKEASKYDKQYKNLDYDTIKDIVDTKNNYLVNIIKEYNFK